MVKFRAYYLCLIFHNKTYGGDRDFWGQVPDSNDSKTIISLLDIRCWVFFGDVSNSTTSRIYAIIFSLPKVFNCTVTIESIFKCIFSNHCYEYNALSVLTC